MEKILQFFGKTQWAGTGTAASVAAAILLAMKDIEGVDPNVQMMAIVIFGLFALGFTVIASNRNPNGTPAKHPYEK